MVKNFPQRFIAYVLLFLLASFLVVAPDRAIASNFTSAKTAAPVRVTTSFDAGWRFFKGEAAGANQVEFDDKMWRWLDVPHDWSIEGPFDEKNPTGKAGGFLPAGVGWYRKSFTLPAGYQSRRVFIEFDGVMANSEVWINGSSVGKRPFGYVSFRYELTGHLNFGGKQNVLAVRADNSGQPASRWYSGAGIYRHVRLVVTDPVHIEHWGTFVTTPQVSADKATVNVQGEIVNQSNASRSVSLQVTVFDPNGRAIQTAETKPQPVPAGATVNFNQDVIVNNPQLWNLDQPKLYRAVARLRDKNRTLDDETVTFGIREFRFEPATGFWLNGRNFKILGVCLHHDGSAFGAAVPLDVWERRLKALKELGVNAIRTAHNPPSPEFLDLCDRMGFIVMDELFDAWTVAKNPFDYHLYFKEWALIDLRDTVRRDRNHPSVILYSAGNEIHDTPKPDIAKPILASLVKAFHEADPTRPVTQGLFRPNVSKDYDNGLADMLDVVGQNYRPMEILAAYRQNPKRKILGTENRHEINMWLPLRDNPPYSGQFLWTGIDYLGESRGWPDIAAKFGLLDRTGTPYPRAFQRQSWWSNKPMVHITRRVSPQPLTPTDPGYDPSLDTHEQILFSDWTPKNTGPHEEEVEVYSNCEQVELFLNGKSMGIKSKPKDDSPRVWKVPYEPGTISAVGKNGDKDVATHQMQTAGTPAKILLSADKLQIAPVWDDVSYVTVTVVDANGVIVPNASDLISFKVTGPGIITAVDSGDNSSHELFQATKRRAYQGRCFAMIKTKAASGKINLVATANGLENGSITINAISPNKK